jgi:PAS domain S-box-containing protein
MPTTPKPKAQSPKPKAQSPKPKAQSPKPKAQSPKPKGRVTNEITTLPIINALAENLPGMVGFWDAQEKCCFANMGYLNWTGKSHQDMTGMSMREVMGEDLYKLNKPFIDAALRGERVKFERDLTPQVGYTMFVLAEYIPLVLNNEVQGFTSIVTDFTEYKKSQLELESANEQLHKITQELEDSIKIKSSFLKDVSHEIKTPINGILGSLDLIDLNQPVSISAKYLKFARYSCNLLIDLIDDVINFDDIEKQDIKLNFVPIDINAVINQTAQSVHELFSHRPIEFSIDLDPNLVDKVLLDPTRLKQVVSKLLFNSIKNTPRGFVKISTKQISQVLGSTDHPDILKIEIKIEDSGNGIDQKVLDTVKLNPDALLISPNRPYVGAGLGLTRTKLMTEALNGEMLINTKVGLGTTITLSFDVQAEQSVAQTNATLGSQNKEQARAKPIKNKNNLQSTSPQSYPELKGLSVLIVDDDQINLIIASDILSSVGVITTTASDGAAALSILNSSNHYDLVLMDIQMPVMDGVTAARAIRKSERLNNLPIIGFTANTRPEEVQEYLRVGMNQCVSKPISKIALLNAISSQIKYSPLAREASGFSPRLRAWTP